MPGAVCRATGGVGQNEITGGLVAGGDDFGAGDGGMVEQAAEGLSVMTGQGRHDTDVEGAPAPVAATHGVGHGTALGAAAVKDGQTH